MVLEFFKNLGRQRINQVEAKAKAKVASVQAKQKAKAAGKFNKAVDGAVKGGKKGAQAAAKGGGKKKKDKDGGDMGWFSRKKNEPTGNGPAAPEPEAEFGDKTQFIQVVAERPKECVGWVVALNGPLKGQDFRLVTGKNVLGTAADSDIVLTDQYMSARHAVIRHEEGTFVLVDLDSTNGSYVNDQRCSKEELIDNDRVRLGRSELKFKSLY
jgi:hypothetical protein